MMQKRTRKKYENIIESSLRISEAYRNKAEKLILKYLDNCNIELKNGYANYYDEDIPLKEIQGSKKLIITTDFIKINYHRDMNFDELIDLYNVVKSYFK